MPTSQADSGEAMTAVRFHGPGRLQVEQVPVPAVGHSEALVKVQAVGICTTDRKIARRGHFRINEGNTPLTLGHEVTGTIVQVGSNVTIVRPGQRVGMVPNTGCGHCAECLRGLRHICPEFSAIGITFDGGMAEYMLIPESYLRDGNAVTLPEELDVRTAALLEPLSCCFSGLEACELKPGESVVVVGGGALGLMTVALASAMGASPVLLVDPHAQRIDRGKRLGADDALKTRDIEATRDWIFERTAGRGIDVAIVAVSSPEVTAAAPTWMARQGRVNWFASLAQEDAQVQVDANLVHYRQIRITGTTGASVWQYRQALRLLQSARFDAGVLVTATYPLKEALRAFEEADSRQHARVLLEPPLAR